MNIDIDIGTLIFFLVVVGIVLFLAIDARIARNWWRREHAARAKERDHFNGMLRETERQLLGSTRENTRLLQLIQDHGSVQHHEITLSTARQDEIDEARKAGMKEGIARTMDYIDQTLSGVGDGSLSHPVVNKVFELASAKRVTDWLFDNAAVSCPKGDGLYLTHCLADGMEAKERILAIIAQEFANEARGGAAAMQQQLADTQRPRLGRNMSAMAEWAGGPRSKENG